MSSKISGFGVRKTRTRQDVVFFVRRVVNGKDHRRNIGNYRHMSIAEARELAIQELRGLDVATDLPDPPILRAIARLDKKVDGLVQPAADPAAVKKSTKTLAEVVELYRATAYPGLKPVTRAGYDITLEKHILPVFGELDVAEIGEDALERFAAGFMEQGQFGAGKKAVKQLLTVLRLAARKQMIARVPKPKTNWPKNQKVKSLDSTGVSKVIDEVTRSVKIKADSYARCIYYIAHCGERRKAAAGLRVEHIDFERKLVTRGRKHDSIKQIPISDHLCNFLREECLPHARDGWVFPKPFGRQGHVDPQYVCARFNVMCKNAGVALLDGRTPSPHTLRHTLATILEASGVPHTAIKTLLGHSSLDSTRAYLHGQAGTARVAANIGARILLGTQKTAD